MKKSINLLTLSLLLVMFGVCNSFAQNTYVRGIGYVVDKPDKIAEAEQNIETFKFDRIKIDLQPGSSINIYNEHQLVKKRSTTRLKFIFDNNLITRIVVEGYGETLPKDIERGVYILTIKPKNTQIIKSTIYYADNRTEVNEQRVIVLNLEKLGEAYKNIKAFRKNNDIQSENKYMDQLFEETTKKKKK